MSAVPSIPQRDRMGFYKIPSGTRLPDGEVTSEQLKLISVTTALGKGWADGKDGLAFWSAGEAAQAALDFLPALVRASRRPEGKFLVGNKEYASAFHFLRMAATRKRDEAADLGGAIHDAIEAYILGKPAPKATPEQRPFMEAFQNFLADEEPIFHATELVVAHPVDQWAGKLDALMELPKRGPGISIVDWKSGKGNRKKGLCEWPSASIQLSTYSKAIMAWDRGSESQVDLPEITNGYIVHLRPDHHPERGYGIAQAPYPRRDETWTQIRDRFYQQFLRCRETAEFLRSYAGKQGMSPPLPMIRTESAA